MEPIIRESKAAGWKTTEFWLTLITVILTAILSSGVVDDIPTVSKVLAAVVAGLTALGYVGGRALLKVSAINAAVDLEQVSRDRQRIASEERREIDRLEVQRMDLKERNASREELRAALKSRVAVPSSEAMTNPDPADQND